ncbi:MAG: HlyC/CorC family transporter [Alphaproteobacteria bacterium]|nr:HlyC/CorC family transporter [Alphaproteobacteria bacterium]
MLSSFLLLISFILLLIVLSGFFSGSETALTATSRAHMHRLANSGNRRAKTVNYLLAQRERLISAILLGNNLVNILASVLATSLFLQLFGETGLIYATLTMTGLVVIFAEVLPKTYAILTPDRTALRVAYIIQIFVFLFSPFTWALQHSVQYIMRSLGFDSKKTKRFLPAHEEIRGAIDLHHSEDAVTKGDRDMLGGILDLKDLTVGDVMVHRKNIMMIEVNLPASEIIKQVLESPYTRIPLWQSEPENIVSVLHAKDLLRALAGQSHQTGQAHDKNNLAHDKNKLAADKDKFDQLDIQALASAPWFVPETTGLAEQLNAFRDRKTHFALVIDEYGALMGLVTLEDILEEIVGQIDDEHDEPESALVPKADGSLQIDGNMTIRDLNRETGWKLPDDEATTVAGLVIHESRTIPSPGQVFAFHGLRFKIITRTRNQITRLEVKPD